MSSYDTQNDDSISRVPTLRNKDNLLPQTGHTFFANHNVPSGRSMERAGRQDTDSGPASLARDSDFQDALQSQSHEESGKGRTPSSENETLPFENVGLDSVQTSSASLSRSPEDNQNSADGTEEPNKNEATAPLQTSNHKTNRLDNHGTQVSIKRPEDFSENGALPYSAPGAANSSNSPGFGGESSKDIHGQTIVTAPPDNRRVWVASLVIVTCYVMALMTLPPISTQYLNHQIGRDRYNFSVDPDESETDCDNSSSAYKDMLNRVQRDTAGIVLKATVAAGIPSIITCLVVGSYSDFLGRRPLLFASVLGSAVRVGSLAAVIGFDLPIQYFYLGSFVDGALGSYFTMSLSVTAVIADITPVSGARALRFAIIEGTVFVAGALAQLAVGFMIKSWGYLAPPVLTTSMLGIALLVTAFLMPETMVKTNREPFVWNPALHMRKVFGFYFVKSSGGKRRIYLLCLGVYFCLMLTNLGRSNIEMLFVLNAPICWSSVDIGIYQSMRLIVCSVTAVAVLRMLRNRLSLHVTGIICGLSAAGGFVMESFATSGALMYLAALVGILYITTFPIPRALMSQITSPAEQGALFSSLSFVETAGSMLASMTYTFIYNATLDVFKGAVFMLMALMCALSVVLLGFLWLRQRGHPLLPDSETDICASESESTSSSSQSIMEGSVQHRRSHQAEGQADEKTPLLA